MLTRVSLHAPGALHRDTTATPQLERRPKKLKKRSEPNLNQIPHLLREGAAVGNSPRRAQPSPALPRRCEGGCAWCPDTLSCRLSHGLGGSGRAAGECGCVCLCLHALGQGAQGRQGAEHTGEPAKEGSTLCLPVISIDFLLRAAPIIAAKKNIIYIIAVLWVLFFSPCCLFHFEKWNYSPPPTVADLVVAA